MMLEQFDDVLEMEEVCAALKLSRNSVYRILKSGELKGYQYGRIWKVPKVAVIMFIKKKSGLE